MLSNCIAETRHRHLGYCLDIVVQDTRLRVHHKELAGCWALPPGNTNAFAGLHTDDIGAPVGVFYAEETSVP